MDKIIEKKPWYRRNVIYILIGCVTLSIIGYFLFSSSDGTKFKVDKNQLSIAEVRNDLFKDFIYVTGEVEPIETVFLDATEGGRVEKIFKEEGELVKKGEPILELSNDKLVLEISNNEAQVERAINDLEQTKVTLLNQDITFKNRLNSLKFELRKLKRTLDRNEILFKKQFISREDLEFSRENYEKNLGEYNLLKEKDRLDSIFRSNKFNSSKKSIRRMYSNIGLTRARLEKLTLRSSVNGELASLNPKVGEVISYGKRIGAINILDSYKINVEVDEFYISRISKGLKGDCEFAGENFSSTINKVYQEVTEVKFFVDMIFDKEIPKEIRIGQTTRIGLQLGESKKVILLPTGSFYTSTGGNWVYVLDESKATATKRKIKIGRRNPQYFEVLEGLKKGEQVIISNYDTFGEVDQILIK